VSQFFVQKTNLIRVQVDPASSRVIYDTVSHASAVGAAGSNYGYANTTVATDVAPNGVTAHAVTISGLAPATTYYFRAISQ
jgi:hypothetical protein